MTTQLRSVIPGGSLQIWENKYVNSFFAYDLCFCKANRLKMHLRLYKKDHLNLPLNKRRPKEERKGVGMKKSKGKKLWERKCSISTPPQQRHVSFYQFLPFPYFSCFFPLFCVCHPFNAFAFALSAHMQMRVNDQQILDSIFACVCSVIEITDDVKMWYS